MYPILCLINISLYHASFQYKMRIIKSVFQDIFLLFLPSGSYTFTFILQRLPIFIFCSATLTEGSHYCPQVIRCWKLINNLFHLTSDMVCNQIKKHIVFIQYLMSAQYMSGIVSGTRDTILNRISKNLCL